MRDKVYNKPVGRNALTSQPAERFGEILCDLRGRIIAGEFGLGERLPSRREFATYYRTTLVTLQKVFDHLSREGFVSCGGPRGTFVATHPPHLFHFALVMQEYISKSRYIRALSEEAERLTEQGPERVSVYWDIDRHASSEGQQRLMADIASRRLAGCILDMNPAMLGDNPILKDKTVAKVALARESLRSDIPVITTATTSWYGQALDWLVNRGRSRVAWLGIPNINTAHIDEAFLGEAARRSVATSSSWTLAVSPDYPRWIPNAIAAIFRGDAKTRPNALLITDDNIAESAITALNAIGLRIPQDLDVVCLNNFPLPLDVPPTVCQLGIDIGGRLHACLDILRRMRAGETVPPTTFVVPTFTDFSTRSMCDTRKITCAKRKTSRKGARR